MDREVASQTRTACQPRGCDQHMGHELGLYCIAALRSLVLGRLWKPLRRPVPMPARTRAMFGWTKADPDRDSFMLGFVVCLECGIESRRTGRRPCTKLTPVCKHCCDSLCRVFSRSASVQLPLPPNCANRVALPSELALPVRLRSSVGHS